MKKEFYSTSGRALTRGLFWETSTDKDTVIYTLKDHPHEGFPSLYELYMDTEDPTEFTFAHEHMAGWSHWQMLVNSTWFKEFVDRWRWELELKIKANALKRLIAESTAGGKNSYATNKFLIEGGWEAKKDAKNPVGRPTMERIKQEAERLNILEREILDDHARIN